jgi:hypothetical protein
MIFKNTRPIVALLAVVIACGAFATEAAAKCAPEGRTAKAVPRVAWPDHPATAPKASHDDASIVGLWKVDFISGGMIVNQGWEQWHSDGTEIMNDQNPPALGNVCLGVWEKTGRRTYKLVHPFWIFDPTGRTAVNVGIERVRVTLSPDGNRFTGTFTWDTYEFDGTLVPGDHVEGTIEGTRISVGSAFPF